MCFNNTRLGYTDVGGSCEPYVDYTDYGPATFDCHIVAGTYHWSVGIFLTDGLWINNTQLDYFMIGGACHNDMKVGVLCFSVHNAVSYTNWALEVFVLQM